MAIQRLTSNVENRFDLTDKSLKVLADRVHKIESNMKSGMISELGNQSKILSEKGGNFVVKYVLEAQIPMIWMGVDMREKFEAFATANSSLDSRAFTKKLAVQMWGDRMIRYNKISVHNRQSKQPHARPSLQKKDPVGFAIFKALIVKWDTGSTLAMTTSESLAQKATEDAIQSAIDKMEGVLNASSEARVESLLKVANGYGLDTNDRNARVKYAWYWDLIDTGHSPTPTWTVWDEIVQKEIDDLKADRSRGLEESMDEQSETLKRIRQFQNIIEIGEDIDQALYDQFGAKVIV